MRTLVTLTLLMLLATIALASGCGGDDLVGTTWGADAGEMYVTFTFEEDGWVAVEFSGGSGEAESHTGSYTVDGDTVVVSDSGESKTFVREGESTMRGQVGGVELVLTRQ